MSTITFVYFGKEFNRHFGELIRIIVNNIDNKIIKIQGDNNKIEVSFNGFLHPMTESDIAMLLQAVKFAIQS